MKVLIADDDSIARLILEKLLNKWGVETEVAEDGIVALEKMEGPNPPRLVVLDWEMPRMDGMEVCRRLRAKETSDPPYIIFLTAKESPEDMARALDAGASDCLRKPYDRHELEARIRAGERTLRLQAQLNEARREMAHLAMYDPLTEVYNRRAMKERLEQELARIRRFSSSLTIGVADLDNFKQINDTWGHYAGDAVILSFVKGVQSTLRRYDVVGRWGGEEFLILAPDSQFKEENTLYERIRRHTEDSPVMFSGQEIHYTVSIGVAAALPDESPVDLLQRADQALYKAKEDGKNSICWAESLELTGKVRSRA